VHDAEHRIAVLEVLDHHAHCAYVDEIIEPDSFPLHLSPDAVNVLRPAAHLCFDASSLELNAQDANDLINVGFAILALFVQLARQILVGFRFEATEGQVFQFPLQLPDAEPVGQRRKQLQGFACGVFARIGIFFRCQFAQPLHLVGELDHHDAHILRHRQEHFAQRFELRYAIIGFRACDMFAAQSLDLRHARRTVHQRNHGRAKSRVECVALRTCCYRRAEQQRRRNRLAAHSQTAENSGGGARVIHPRLPGAMLAARILLPNPGVCTDHQFALGLRQPHGQRLKPLV
jgi:hypothetical protein